MKSSDEIREEILRLARDNPRRLRPELPPLLEQFEHALALEYAQRMTDLDYEYVDSYDRLSKLVEECGLLYIEGDSR